MFQELTDEELAGTTTTYEAPVQHGPLRRFDRPARCASRGCGTETYYKVLNAPRCMTHALRELNELLIEAEGK